MPKAPEWSLGFSFSAKDKGLLEQLKAIQERAQSAADSLSKIQDSFKFSEGTIDLKKVSTSVKTAKKSFDELGKTREEMWEGAEDALGLGEGAKFFEEKESPIFMTSEQRRTFELQVQETAKAVQLTADKMEKSYRSFSSTTLKSFDMIFEAIHKGTITSLPHFRELASVLAETPLLALRIRRRFEEVAKSQKATSKDAIWLLEYHERSIREAIEGSKKLNDISSEAAKNFGHILEGMFPVPRELELIGAAAAMLIPAFEKPAKYISTKFSDAFLSLKKSFLGIFKEKIKPPEVAPIETKVEPPKIVMPPKEPDINTGEGSATGEKIGEAITEGITTSLEKNKERLNKSLRESVDEIDISGNLSHKLESEIRQGMVVLDTLGRETVKKYLLSIKKALSEKDSFAEMQPKIQTIFDKSSSGLREVGRSAGGKFILGIRDLLDSASLSQTVNDLFQRSIPSNFTVVGGKVEEGLKGLMSNFVSLRDVIRDVSTDSSYSIIGLRDTTTSAFDAMGASKDAFLTNLSEAANQIPKETKKISDAFESSSISSNLSEGMKAATELESHLMRIAKAINEINLSPSVPTAKLPEEARQQMGVRVGSIQDVIESASRASLPQPARSPEKVIDTGALMSQTSILREIVTAVNKLQAGRTNEPVRVYGSLQTNPEELSRALKAKISDTQGTEGNGR